MRDRMRSLLPSSLRGGAGAGRAALAVGLLAMAVAGGGRLYSTLSKPDIPPAYLPALVQVPPGEITIIDADGVVAPGPDAPRRRVVFARPYWIGKFEITFDQWDYCYREGGCTHLPKDRGWGRANRPVIDISWEDAGQYLAWLSGATGRHYRLPTRDEWEYAARAGGAPPEVPEPLFDDPRLAWAADYLLTQRPVKKTDPVDAGDANDFGIYGTAGNVWEWTDSCWEQTYGSGADRTRRENCAVRVLQGAHRSYMPGFVRDIGSGGCSTRPMPGNFGFRVVRDS